MSEKPDDEVIKAQLAQAMAVLKMHKYRVVSIAEPDPRDEAISELAKCLNNCRRYQVCDELDKIMDPVLTKYAAQINAAGVK